LSALGHAIVEGMTAAATWALGGLTDALNATTGVDFTGSGFATAWGAARAVAVIVGLPVFFIALIQAVIQGSMAILGRVAAMLPLAAIGMLVGLVAAQGYAALVSVASKTMIAASGDTPAKALGKIAAAMLAAAPGGFGAPLVMLVLLAAVVLVASMIIWIELSVAHGAAYLVMVFIPVGLAVSTWGVGQRFLRRLAEVLVALLSVPFVITAAMVVSGALISQGTFALGTPGSQVALLTQGVIVLLLGTLALPATMRLTHLAADAAVVAGVGGYAAKKAAHHIKQAPKKAAAAAAGGPAGAAAAGSGSPGPALRLPGEGGGGPGGSSGAGEPPNPGRPSPQPPSPPSSGPPGAGATNGAASGEPSGNGSTQQGTTQVPRAPRPAPPRRPSPARPANATTPGTRV
jgi:hypothetical protein